MARLVNREALTVVLGGTLAVLLIGWFSDLGIYLTALLVGWLVASIPIAMLVQQSLVPLYLQLGFENRALQLALDIRGSAPNRRLRDMASIDVAMVQVMLGRLDDALRNLDGVNVRNLQDGSHALVLGNRAWCRAHLDRQLDRALEEAREARKLSPDEGILEYFEGLVRLRQGETAEARTLVERSLEREKDPRLPVPGERAWMLARIAATEGDLDRARSLMADALRQAGKRNPFLEQMRRTSEELRGSTAA